MPAGLEVYSRPVGPKNTVCRYRTTRDVMLNPLNISGVTMTTEPDGRSLLRMRFACSTQADWSHADLSQLKLLPEVSLQRQQAVLQAEQQLRAQIFTLAQEKQRD